MQVAAILFGAVFTVATATALGTLLLGKACGDWPVRFVLGSGALSFLVFLLAASGLVYPAAFAILGVAAIVASQPWNRWRDGPGVRCWPKPSARNILLFVIFLVYFYIYFLRALAPEVSPDGATYHLGLTARYLREHGFHTITWNLYASLSQGMEMLFLFAFAFGRHSAAALVHLAFLVALVWQMGIWGVRHGMAWVGVCGAALVALSPMVMGIVNVTPDSFFPASRTEVTEQAVLRGLELFAQGCDVVDVGGESTRPGATPVGVDEELARVVPVVAALSQAGPVSVDTKKDPIARAAVRAGASSINDVSCTLVELAGELGVGYVAMHSQGDSSTMQLNPVYGDVVGEVAEFLRAAARRAIAANVSPLWLDPGIGFGKTVEHNLALLANCAQFVELADEYGAGVLIGTSRKRFLEHLGSETLDVNQRLEGSIATEAWAMAQGVSMVRVHDAVAAVQLRELLVRPVEEVIA